MNESTHRIRSAALNNERTLWLCAPRDPVKATRVFIFLDGEFYRERVDARSVIQQLGDAFADSWQVYVSSHSDEARWKECPCYPPFATFVAVELVDWLDAHVPPLVTERTLVGLSYTGLAAAFAALQHPGVFSRVISQSGSFWWNDAWLPRHVPAQSSATRFYLDVGDREVQERVTHRPDVFQAISQVAGVRQFRDALRAANHPVEYREFNGAHNFESWRAALPAALRWAWQS